VRLLRFACQYFWFSTLLHAWLFAHASRAEAPEVALASSLRSLSVFQSLSTPVAHLAASDFRVDPSESLRYVADSEPRELMPDLQASEDARSAAGRNAALSINDSYTSLWVVHLAHKAVQTSVSLVCLWYHIAPLSITFF